MPRIESPNVGAPQQSVENAGENDTLWDALAYQRMRSDRLIQVVEQYLEKTEGVRVKATTDTVARPQAQTPENASDAEIAVYIHCEEIDKLRYRIEDALHQMRL